MKTILARLFPLTVCLGSLVIAQSNVIDSNAEPAFAPQQAVAVINIRDLSPARVIGCLGKPLGTRTTIDGVQGGLVMLANPLAVSRIDGHAIKGPFYIEIRDADLQKGMQYRLEGYEAGEFAGPPAWSAPLAQQPFQFRSFFVVTKVIEQRAARG